MQTRDRDNDDKKTKKILLGAILAGTALDLSSGTTYAHGNRSSHGATPSVLLGPEDYVLMRQSLLQPNLQETQELLAVSDKIRTFEDTHPNFADADEYKQLLSVKNDLVQKLQVRPITKDVLAFLDDGDLDAAVATIEGSGSVEDVLESYRWVMLDMANTKEDLEDYKRPPKHLPQIMEIARKAREFSEKALEVAKDESYKPRATSIQTTVAELYHNMGSFTHPSLGADTVPAEFRDFGKTCAEGALQLRRDLNQPSETMRAKLLLGEVRLAQKRQLEAMKLFAEAAKEAKDLNELDQAALGLSKVSNLLVREDVDAAETNFREAVEIYRDLPINLRGGLDRQLVPELLEKTRLQIEVERQ